MGVQCPKSKVQSWEGEVNYPSFRMIEPARNGNCSVCGVWKVLAVRDTELAGDGLCVACVDSAKTADRALDLHGHGMCRPGPVVP